MSSLTGCVKSTSILLTECPDMSNRLKEGMTVKEFKKFSTDLYAEYNLCRNQVNNARNKLRGK